MVAWWAHQPKIFALFQRFRAPAGAIFLSF